MKLNVKDFKEGETYTVLLEGKDVSDRCFNADEEGGFVDLYLLDKEGSHSFKLNEAGDAVLNERLFGEVTIRKNEEEE